jgi:uncharacterized protein (DUF1778 family)
MKPKPTVEKSVLSFRVTPETREAIETAAAKERRPVSHWLEIHIENYLKQMKA